MKHEDFAKYWLLRDDEGNVLQVNTEEAELPKIVFTEGSVAPEWYNALRAAGAMYNQLSAQYNALQDLIDLLAAKHSMTKKDAEAAVNSALNAITAALKDGDKVTLVGFGTFIQRHRGARTGQNPQTGQPVTIKASNTVAFKPGKFLKDSVNP